MKVTVFWRKFEGGKILLTSTLFRRILSDAFPGAHSLPFSFPLRFATLLQTFSHVHPSQGHQSIPKLSGREHFAHSGQRGRIFLSICSAAIRIQDVCVVERDRSGTRHFLPCRTGGIRSRISPPPHKHVSSWRVLAPRREHAFPLDLRRQRRGLLRPHNLPLLLPHLRDWCGFVPCSLQPGFHGSCTRRQRGDFGGHGCVHASLPTRADSHTRIHFPVSYPSGLHPWLLVPAPISCRDQRTGRERVGRRGGVGARRRFSARYASYGASTTTIGVPQEGFCT